VSPLAGLAAVRAVACRHVRWGLTSSNVGFTRVFRRRDHRECWPGVTLAVLATGAGRGSCFSWLRRRSGSLIAPIALQLVR